jgi:tetratricopeptide (TPR) repeat protein
MGEALDGLGRTSEAIAEFDAAAKISQTEPNVHFGLGYLYWKTQQYDEAKKEFERELALDSGHAQSLAYLGDIEWKSNHPDAALALLKRARSAQKNLRIVYVDLGAIYMQKKDYNEAQTALLHAVSLDPDLPDAHYQLGRLYQAQGKTADADRELHKVQELHKKAEEGLVGKISSSPPALNPPEDK